MNQWIRVTAATLLLGAAPALAAAQPEWQDRIVVSFDAPVQVPGAKLEAGSYLFQLADVRSTQQVVQIWDEDRQQLFVTAMAVPIARRDATGDVVVKFASTPQGDPPAVKSWFRPGDLRGHQFIYPEEQARQIAGTSRELVLSGDVDDRPEGAGATELSLIDEQGRRQPFETHEPPSVSAARGDAEKGSGEVQLHGLEGEDLIEHHLTHIVRLADASLTESTGDGSQEAVGTTGDTGESPRAGADVSGRSDGETVTIPRAHLEQIREHARKARQKLND